MSNTKNTTKLETIKDNLALLTVDLPGNPMDNIVSDAENLAIVQVLIDAGITSADAYAEHVCTALENIAQTLQQQGAIDEFADLTVELVQDVS